MRKFFSVETIRKMHTFERDIGLVPAYNWMTPEQKENPEETINQTLERLEIVDKNLEVLLGELEDENLQLALGRAYHAEKLSAREMKFNSYLPAGRVQLQIGMIETLARIAKGETTPDEDVKREVGGIRLQAEWDANPKIGAVSIDEKITELYLRNSLNIYLGYLRACENEFYKQALSFKLDKILEHYEMFREVDRENAVPAVLSLTYSDFMFDDSMMRISYILDSIYYNRAISYLMMCKGFWNVLSESEYTKKYLFDLEEYVNLVKAIGL